MRILILTTVMAPYRTELFEELGKSNHIDVCFEEYIDTTRDQNWYERESKNFNILITGNQKSINFEILNNISKKYDIVIFFEYSTPTSVLGIFKCQMNRIPYLINCDGAFIRREPILKFFLKKSLIARATGLLANGVSSIQYFLYYGAQKENLFMHNFSSICNEDFEKKHLTNNVHQLLNSLNINLDNTNIFLTVGRFIKRKNFEFLIHNWEKMADNDVLLIVGNGKEKLFYQELIEYYGFNNVFIVDHMSKGDLFSLYSISVTLLFPTYNEIWGLVVPEAMSQGLPVITTAECNSGTQLIVNGKNGFVLSSSNFEQWKKAINVILCDKEKLIGKKARETVRDLTINNDAKQIEKICKQIIGEING